MAGLIIRGNTWVATYYIAGKNVRKTTKIKVVPKKGSGESARELKKLAQLVADRMEAVAQGKQRAEDAIEAIRLVAGIEQKEQTVRETVERWRDGTEHYKGHGANGAAIRRFLDISGQYADLPLSKFTRAMAEEWMEACLERVSGGTVWRDKITLSAAFNRAIKEGVLRVNPFSGLRLPVWAKNERQQRDIMTPEQLDVIFTKFPGEWPDMVATCLLLGGQRLGDIASLAWSQVDMERGLVTIRTGKTNRLQRCPIIPALRSILERRARDLAPLGTPQVFPYASARLMEGAGKTSKLSIEFGGLLEKHGLRPSRAERLARGETPRAKEGHLIAGISFHSLRATAVTFLLDAGVPPELVRHIVGHDDPAIERRHYYRPSSDSQTAALEQLARLIGRAKG